MAREDSYLHYVVRQHGRTVNRASPLHTAIMQSHASTLAQARALYLTAVTGRDKVSVRRNRKVVQLVVRRGGHGDGRGGRSIHDGRRHGRAREVRVRHECRRERDAHNEREESTEDLPPRRWTGMDEENKRNFLLGHIGARVASALQAVGESLAGEQRLGDAPA